MDLSLSQKFQELFDDINLIKQDTKNKDLQDLFISHIVNIMEYTVATNNKTLSSQMYSFVADIFMIIGELDYDDIERILDALTASRIVLKNLIN